MALVLGGYLFRVCKASSGNFSTSCFVFNKWRKQQGVEPNPHRFGPLINLPDYSFLDGRPVLLSYFKKMKIERQKNLCKRIAELTNEMDVGLKQYYNRMEKEKEERKTILQNKLKPKGAALLKT